MYNNNITIIYHNNMTVKKKKKVRMITRTSILFILKTVFTIKYKCLETILRLPAAFRGK